MHKKGEEHEDTFVYMYTYIYITNTCNNFLSLNMHIYNVCWCVCTYLQRTFEVISKVLCPVESKRKKKVHRSTDSDMHKKCIAHVYKEGLN